MRSFHCAADTPCSTPIETTRCCAPAAMGHNAVAAPSERNELPPPHEHLPRERTLLSTAVKHERARYAIPWERPHFSFRFLPLPAFSWWRFIGLRTGRGARTRLPEGTRIVGQTIPGFAPRTIAHSITSSASESRVGETVRFIRLAVFRLRVKSNLLGRSIGRSAGRAPRRMRSTKIAARRWIALRPGA